MGRETKILLALLGLLAGVFLGVVSVKLFVPRPPAGAGPDVHAAVAMEPQMLVEPPALEQVPPQGDNLRGEASAPPRPDSYAERSSRFAPAALNGDSPRGGDSPLPPPRDPFVMPAAYEAEPPVAAAVAEPAGDAPSGRWTGDVPAAIPVVVGPVPGTSYVTRAGDSWWSLAEQAYGDGRLYRPLFAWNRSLDPRISLVPGTRLEIPPAERLGAAWPALLPAAEPASGPATTSPISP